MSKDDPDYFKSPSTKICKEQPAEDNPYLAQKLSLAGFDLLQLSAKASMVDALFLLLTGERNRNKENHKLLESLMIFLSTPSPRHPGSQAAMACGISKSNSEHLLPISLIALGGSGAGAAEVENAHLYLLGDKRKKIPGAITLNAKEESDSVIAQWEDKHHHLVPGFGCLYGQADPVVKAAFEQFSKIKPDSPIFKWVGEFCGHLNQADAGLLDTGLAAAVFAELGLDARVSVPLYQYLRAPGLLAYAVEQTRKPKDALPWVSDDNYEHIIEQQQEG